MKILVVEYDKEISKSIVSVLEKEEYEIQLASFANQALDAVNQEQPFDLIVLDVVLPDFDGFTLCKMIRAHKEEKKSNVPIIFIADEVSVERRQKGLKIGVSDFVIKSNIRNELIEVVDGLLKENEIFKGLNALIVDDSSTYRFVLNKTLVSQGITVTEANNGVEAYNILLDNRDKFDIIITDNHMPGLNGVDLTKKVRIELGIKDIPIVLVTAHEDDQCVLSFFKNGGTDCLIKPYMKEVLLARMGVHLKYKKQKSLLEGFVAELKSLNAIKNDFLAVCSHDLKSPLNVILGYCQLLLEDDIDEKIKEDIKVILSTAKGLVFLINDILDITRIESGKTNLKLSNINIVEIIKDVIAFNKTLAEKKQIELDYDKAENADENVLVRGNKDALARVLNNIFSNAIKFTRKGGGVTLILDQDRKEVRIAIKDSGVGMNETQLAHLFQRFTSSGRSGTEGEASTGLGLSIVKDLIEQHGGQISADSTVDKGTTISFTLPIPS